MKSLGSIAHTLPRMLEEFVDKDNFFAPLLLSLRIDKNLIKEVDVGAFKIKTDDGQNSRSAAF